MNEKERLRASRAPTPYGLNVGDVVYWYESGEESIYSATVGFVDEYGHGYIPTGDPPNVQLGRLTEEDKAGTTEAEAIALSRDEVISDYQYFLTGLEKVKAIMAAYPESFEEIDEKE